MRKMAPAAFKLSFRVVWGTDLALGSLTYDLSEGPFPNYGLHFVVPFLRVPPCSPTPKLQACN